MKKATYSTSQSSLPLEYQQLDSWPSGYYSIFELDVEDLHNKAVGFDIETNGLDPYDKHCIIKSISISGANSSFCLHREDFKPGLKIIRKIIESEDIMLIGHNIKFDLNFCVVKYGWKIRCLAYDTMVAEYFTDETQVMVSLETLLEKYDMPNYKGMVSRKRMDIGNKYDHLLYNMKDARSVVRLKNEVYDPTLTNIGCMDIMNIASHVIPVLSRMETKGVLVDMSYARQQQLKIYEKMLEFKRGLKTLANSPFNPDSPQELSKVLFGKFGFDVVNLTDRGNGSTDYESIIRIKQEQMEGRNAREKRFINDLLEYGKLGTMAKKYYSKLPTWIKADGCVHTNFNLAVAATGRLTSSEPNMQNQKRGSDFRGVYIARPGYIFLEGDFSQVELRLCAFFAGETKMLKMFEKGLDIHTAVMCEMKGWEYDDTCSLLNDPSHPNYQMVKNLRVGVKNVNFGEMYGASPARLQRELVKNGIYWELDECQQLFNERKLQYPNIVRWKRNIERFILYHKFAVMPFGQVRRLPYAERGTEEGARALRQGINFIIQSTASGWMPIIGMIILDNYFKNDPELDGTILLQVHDSILSEVRVCNKQKMRKVKEDVERIMQNDIKEFIKEVFNFDLTVPLEFKCDYLERWR